MSESCADTIHYGPVWGHREEGESFAACKAVDSELTIMTDCRADVTCPDCKARLSRPEGSR